tara:strand:- start:783 stop:1037 length:255 start_codon:yes stop_codon:yes gene_type:complete
MSAYLIIQATVHDWQKFAKYTEVVPPLVEKFGGQYIAMGQPELIEGQDAPKSVVISQWRDCQAATKQNLFGQMSATGFCATASS